MSDYTSPTGEFGIPLNNPRFLEWIDVPESASLLEMSPGWWINALSRDTAMAAAVRMQRDVCLMTTNLDQYALSLQSTASKMIERSPGASDFPLAEVAAGTLVYGRPNRPKPRNHAVGLEMTPSVSKSRPTVSNSRPTV